MRTPIKHRTASYSITPAGGPLGDNVYRVMIFDGENYQPSQVIQLNITLAEPPQIGDTITMEWAHSTYFAAPEMTFRVLGILRDLPRDTVGDAIIEIPDPADEQVADAPEGVRVNWITRAHGRTPGEAALASLRALPQWQEPVSAFVAGEQKLA